jgi:DNA helicase HerA-like ATPase
MGIRGHGKSHLAGRVHGIFPRKIIFDFFDEYSEGIIVNSFEEYSAKLIEFKKNKTPSFKLIYKFNPEIDAHDEYFNHACRLAYYFGDVQVTIEEVQRFSSAHKIAHWLANLIFLGRHKNISLLITIQRPGQLNKAIFSQCRHVFIGYIQEKNDLEYCFSFLGSDAEKLKTIPEQYFLYYRPREITKIVHNSLGKSPNKINLGTLQNQKSSEHKDSRSSTTDEERGGPARSQKMEKE